ncbi:hypothetical protein QTP70_024617 [Hemibagrus guttatus]|uniref:Uncharacterized protein n=1 Tax=Hemibagrus guttatus TaxID=175788 RepID=A0AAE0US15_9TELE|nr:hypothetical protein QTP70_024617 [Hemibagrus guttatus]KAK3540945.1 hypothetical protein QTP86_006402 [Hemibagrus guttatus]
MRYTFKPDDCMVITIPLASVRNAREGQLMPDKFTCRFKDSYKLYQRGRPKALGVAQIATAVFILCLAGLFIDLHFIGLVFIFMIPSILMKVSFVFNILGLCLAIIQASLAFVFMLGPYHFQPMITLKQDV